MEGQWLFTHPPWLPGADLAEQVLLAAAQLSSVRLSLTSESNQCLGELRNAAGMGPALPETAASFISTERNDHNTENNPQLLFTELWKNDETPSFSWNMCREIPPLEILPVLSYHHRRMSSPHSASQLQHTCNPSAGFSTFISWYFSVTGLVPS